MNTSPDPIRILHVDDDPDFAAVVSTTLEREGDFEVVTATDAEEGLARLAETSVDCVVSDYRMPDRDGVEFLEAVREEYPDLPFVMFTGGGSEAVASEAMAAGVTDYLPKRTDDEQPAVLASRVRDAVDRYRTGREMRDAHRAMEVANQGIGRVDEEGRFVYVNETYAETYGYDPDELIGRRWETLCHESDVDRIREEVLPEVVEEGTWRGEIRGVRKDGSEVVGDHSLVSAGDDEFVCAVRDVTGRKERERELAELEGKYRRLVEQNLVGIYVIRDREFDYVNPRLAEIFGETPEDMIGRSPLEWIHPDDHERVRENLRKREEGEIEDLQFTVRGKRADGGEIEFEVHGGRVEIDGEPAILGALQDVTERRERKRELERTNERLDEFASVVSHDLRNPLNAAEGHLELAREECDTEHHDSISRSHERMEALIDDLLTLARQGETATEVERVDLGKTVADCWRNVETGEATLVAEADAVIRADAGQLRQVLENLIGNAIEHGGETVRVGDLDEGFYVEDDGPGIPPDERDGVFEPGYSTDPDGTGFGLSIVEEIAEAHGWTVRVTEGREGGARFEVVGVDRVDE